MTSTIINLNLNLPYYHFFCLREGFICSDYSVIFGTNDSPSIISSKNSFSSAVSTDTRSAPSPSLLQLALLSVQFICW